MHSFIARPLYQTAAKFRNPSLHGELDRLFASEFLPQRELTQIQLARLVDLLDHAGTWSSYYGALFRKLGFRPSGLSSVEDLKRLPIIEKASLIEHNKSIHSSFAFRRTFKAETSGTSGTALEFFKSERWDSTVRAHLYRGYARFGVHPADRNGYLWGYNLRPSQQRKVRLLDWMQNRERLFQLDTASVEAFARRLRTASYLSGYSSMVYEIAKVVNKAGIELPHLKMVKGTSEMILDAYQVEAERAFGRRIISEYGAAEAGLIAFECEKGALHVNCEDVILETEADGSVLVTNLVSHSFPIIRYRLGDVVSMSGARCDCGRAHPVIDAVQGRRGSVVIGHSQSYPALVFYYVFKNIAIESGILMNYRALQDEPGKVTLLIEHGANAVHTPLIESQLTRYFRSDVDVDLAFVDEFPRERRKAQYFESRIGTRSTVGS